MDIWVKVIVFKEFWMNDCFLAIEYPSIICRVCSWITFRAGFNLGSVMLLTEFTAWHWWFGCVEDHLSEKKCIVIISIILARNCLRCKKKNWSGGHKAEPKACESWSNFAVLLLVYCGDRVFVYLRYLFTIAAGQLRQPVHLYRVVSWRVESFYTKKNL